MLNVYRLDVSSIPPDKVDELYQRLVGFAFMVDEKRDPQTRKILYFRVFLENNSEIEALINGFDGVKCTDITGTDLLNP